MNVFYGYLVHIPFPALFQESFGFTYSNNSSRSGRSFRQYSLKALFKTDPLRRFQDNSLYKTTAVLFTARVRF